MSLTPSEPAPASNENPTAAPAGRRIAAVLAGAAVYLVGLAILFWLYGYLALWLARAADQPWYDYLIPIAIAWAIASAVVHAAAELAARKLQPRFSRTAVATLSILLLLVLSIVLWRGMRIDGATTLASLGMIAPATLGAIIGIAASLKQKLAKT